MKISSWQRAFCLYLYTKIAAGANSCCPCNDGSPAPPQMTYTVYEVVSITVQPSTVTINYYPVDVPTVTSYITVEVQVNQPPPVWTGQSPPFNDAGSVSSPQVGGIPTPSDSKGQASLIKILRKQFYCDQVNWFANHIVSVAKILVVPQ